MNRQGNHPHMQREERAKQFMPFAALKGYEEALRKVEEEVERKNTRKNEPFTEDLSNPQELNN